MTTKEGYELSSPCGQFVFPFPKIWSLSHDSDIFKCFTHFPTMNKCPDKRNIQRQMRQLC